MARPYQRKDRDGFWIRWKDGRGRWRSRRGGDTEAEAWAELDAEEWKAKGIRQGRLRENESETLEQSGRPLDEVIAEYETWLRQRRNTEAYVKEAVRCVRAVVKGIGAKCLADIKPRPVQRWLGELLTAGKSARTYNAYLIRTCGLLNWAVKFDMLEKNPLGVIDKQNERADQRNKSRALTPDEFTRLIDATPDDDRKLYYLFAGWTGLRWGEVRGVRWQDIDLAKGLLYLQAASTKARRADILPMPPELVELLQVREKHMGPVFGTSPQLRTFQRDLQRAGIEYDGARGQADRKSLRKTFCTHLAMSGTDLRTTQRLMRHSDIRLTAEVYTEVSHSEMREAVSRVSALGRKEESLGIGMA